MRQKKDFEALEEILMRDGHLATAGIVRANVITNLMMVEPSINQSYK